MQAVLRDQTDAKAELVQELEWLLLPPETVELQGNAFALENVHDESGTVFLLLAPPAHARAHPRDWDVRVRNGKLELNRDDHYEWAELSYTGGKWGRIAAVQAFQRQTRPFSPERDGLLLSNTWGDRGRDAHLNPEFMRREIEAAARLGVDVVQIDDGWEQGITQNSARAKESKIAAWNGFWESDPNFWDVNRARFPDGLEPLIQQAREHGMKFGLWFAPDTSGDGANWERDARAILGLHRTLGVDFFKIDALKIHSPQNEANLRHFFALVARESENRVTFDLDITAEDRFGYFGLIEPGPLFVQNRYTDWHRHWPHQTLRVAWQLAHWVDPLRLRLEWLNNARHVEQYQGDPLAPALWSPDALFATVMMCSPLGWFEIQNLPERYFDEAAPLIATWKQHRHHFADGPILPIGGAPDGVAWTGFFALSADQSGGYALIFRELNPRETWEVELPFLTASGGACEVLGGKGTAKWDGRRLKIEGVEKLGFVWVRLV